MIILTLLMALTAWACEDKKDADKPEEKPKPAADAQAEAPPAPDTAEAPKEEPPPAEAAKATAKMEAKSESKLTGEASFEETEKGVKVTLEVAGVEPGEHGAHVHEKGDCSAPDGTSAGGHFNPAGHDHALPDGEQRHLGDLGNITVAEDGTGTLEIEVAGANLKAGDPNSFVGKAVIVHAKKDDGGQPTGNAGGRIGCGVVTAAAAAAPGDGGEAAPTDGEAPEDEEAPEEGTE